jgi:sterol desaturase/sphingolipid hydroxylase (fatty acid hydroxylase superfamily)
VPELPDVVLWSIPAFILLTALEAISYRFHPDEDELNTPSHHRVHHASQGSYLDRNFGGILIVWDRLFGTFEPERERPIYGLTKNIKTHNPVRVAFHEYASIAHDVRVSRRWTDRLRAIVRMPQGVQ